MLSSVGVELHHFYAACGQFYLRIFVLFLILVNVNGKSLRNWQDFATPYKNLQAGMLYQCAMYMKFEVGVFEIRGASSGAYGSSTARKLRPLTAPDTQNCYYLTE
jgi:hypothetical protein